MIQLFNKSMGLLLLLFLLVQIMGKPRCYSRDHRRPHNLLGKWKPADGDPAFKLAPHPYWENKWSKWARDHEHSKQSNLRYYPNECIIDPWDEQVFSKVFSGRKLILTGDSITENVFYAFIMLMEQSLQMKGVEKINQKLITQRGNQREDYLLCVEYAELDFTLCLIRSDCSPGRAFKNYDLVRSAGLEITDRDVLVSSTGRHSYDCSAEYVACNPRLHSHKCFDSRIKEFVDVSKEWKNFHQINPVEIFLGRTAAHWTNGQYHQDCKGETNCNECGWTNGQLPHPNSTSSDWIDDLFASTLDNSRITMLRPYIPTLLAGPQIHFGGGDCTHIALSFPLQMIVELIVSSVKTDLDSRKHQTH